MVVAVATMLEVGAKPPPPMTERRAQVNVRLSQEDKTLLESAAREHGFNNLSEFVREAALRQSKQKSAWTERVSDNQQGMIR